MRYSCHSISKHKNLNTSYAHNYLYLSLILQERGGSTRRGRNKTYEYIKREIETRERRKPTKVDLKNMVS